jgi:hypothetical protein
LVVINNRRIIEEKGKGTIKKTKEYCNNIRIISKLIFKRCIVLNLSLTIRCFNPSSRLDFSLSRNQKPKNKKQIKRKASSYLR